MRHGLGEGAAIFTDMTETMLTALDKQMALSDMTQKPKGSYVDVGFSFCLVLIV